MKKQTQQQVKQEEIMQKDPEHNNIVAAASDNFVDVEDEEFDPKVIQDILMKDIKVVMNMAHLDKKNICMDLDRKQLSFDFDPNQVLNKEEAKKFPFKEEEKKSKKQKQSQKQQVKNVQAQSQEANNGITSHTSDKKQKQQKEQKPQSTLNEEIKNFEERLLSFGVDKDESEKLVPVISQEWIKKYQTLKKKK